MSGRQCKDSVLALYPFSRGLAFVFFEGPLSPVDWAVKEVRGAQKNARSLEMAKRLIGRLQPDVVVLDDRAGRRSQRIRRLQRLIASHAEGQVIEVQRFTRREIRQCFGTLGASTRYEIAQVIASRIDAFSHRVPPVRKIWKSEAPRMKLFDAASLAMTFYCRCRGPLDSLEEPAP